MSRPPWLALVALAVLAGTSAGQEPYRAPLNWKQGIEYRIEARLDESSEVLRGRARLRYRNDSPDTLDEFFFHLHLNAFRPNSAWARRDLEFGITTFQDLGPEEHGFERITEITVDGRPVFLRYPYAPDSTVVGFDLPDPLEPGETVTMDYAWDARPSSEPRRQGRRGRQYDFAQWYPRVVVYDDEGWRPHPLYRSGEFYGDFALYDVTLEVREDQVMGATGVPVSGDPGWDAAQALGTGPIDYQREWYGSLDPTAQPCIERGEERICGTPPARYLREEESLGHLAGEPTAGWKRVRWFAEDVHHFAWSTSPDYVYEQGRWEDVTIHVLYQPGDEESWGGGVAVRRTAEALQWLDRIFGDYAYPHVTNLHRIEGGGTEFPMVVMNGSASQGLILHEVGHIYAHGILGNNEWLEGWLDEGLSSFQTDWYAEQAGGGAAVWEDAVLTTVLLDLQGVSEPVVLPAERYAEHAVYNQMVYTKGEVVLWMLREMAGEEAFTRILRTYYDRYRFRHVDSGAFQGVAEEVLSTDLDWFFGPWLHGTGVVDYALEDVETVPGPRGGWQTTLQLERVGDRVMPVPLRLRGADGEVRDTVLPGWSRESRHQVATPFLPRRVEIDPEGTILDWNVLNDGAPARGPFSPAIERGLDEPLLPLPFAWKRVPVRLFPLGWWNDGGGYVAGLQSRALQLGSLNRVLLRVGLPAVPLGEVGDRADLLDPGSVYLRLENPVWGGRPRWGTALELLLGEGRGYLGWRREHEEREPPLSGRPSWTRLFGSVYWVYDPQYLVEGRWTPERKAGLEAGVGARGTLGEAGSLSWDGSLATGFDSRDHRWARAALVAAGTAGDAEGPRLRGRLFAGAAIGPDPGSGSSWKGEHVPRERMFFAAGGGPFEALSNPWVRSHGAPLADEGLVPGGGELRGFHPGVALPALATLTGELLAPSLTTGGSAGAGGWSLTPLLFAGAGAAGALPRAFLPGTLGAWPDAEADPTLYAVAGAGLEAGRTGSPIRVKLDLPFWVSEERLAAMGRDSAFALRWSIMVVGY